VTPAEHYTEAERWLRTADNLVLNTEAGPKSEAANASFDAFVSRAQVHATLATVDPDALWPLREASETRGVGVFPCPVCGRRFRSGAQVLDHSIVHETQPEDT
jgi:hypothetical protein